MHTQTEAPARTVDTPGDAVLSVSRIVGYFTSALDVLSLRRSSRPNVPAGQVGFLSGDEFIAVRVLQADDSNLLRQFLQEGLSEDSRYKRFLSHMPRVSASVAAYLAERDGRDRVALVALTHVGEPRIVGMVEYALWPNDEAAPEIAVAVADAYQGRGIGKNLVSMLATLSLAGGHREWSGEVLSGNGGVIHTLATVGTVDVGPASSGVCPIVVTLDPARVFAVGT